VGDKVGVLLGRLIGSAVLGLIGAVMAISIAATVKVVVSPVFVTVDEPADG
jgi:predicted PurR-regulated permease PerM